MPRSQEVILTNMCLIEDAAGRFVMQIRSPERYAWSGAALPGGAMELGEGSVDACEREFYEETGIRVKIKRLLNVYTKDVSSYQNADIAQTVVILYEVEETEDYDITGFHNEETLEIAFFSQEEIA